MSDTSHVLTPVLFPSLEEKALEFPSEIRIQTKQSSLFESPSLPILLSQYIDRSIDKKERNKRKRLSQEIIDNQFYSFYGNPNNYIDRLLSDWIYKFWHAKPNLSSDQRRIDTMRHVVVATDILNGNKAEKDFIYSTCCICLDDDEMINNLKQIFPEYASMIQNIVTEHNSFYYKFKTSKLFAPAFNGSGCSIL